MKKIAAFLMIGFGALHVVGFTYLLLFNYDKYLNNMSYFNKKIVIAVLIGLSGLALLKAKSDQKN
jgi:hypothetical protein